MSYFLDQKAFLEASKSSDFIQKTQQQIAKDFALATVPFDVNFEHQSLTTEQLLEQIAEQLLKVVQSGEQRVLQLFYQIDIPQSVFLDHLNRPDMIQELSELILRRVAYKVFLRSQF